MISRYWKLWILCALAGITIMLSTTVLTLKHVYARRFEVVQQQSTKRKSDGRKRTHTHLKRKNGGHSKTIRKSFAVDSASEIFLRQKVAPNTENFQTAAYAHLGEALQRIPFEVEGIKEFKGNALSPPLLHGATVEGGDDTLIKNLGDRETFHHSSKDPFNRKRRGGFVRMIRSLLTGNKHNVEKKDTIKLKKYQIEKEALFHLEKAAEMGNNHAQNIIANVLASGILPITNHPELRASGNMSLNVISDFSDGGEQLARALMLWHLSAMDGNIEAAMALGYRHRFSAKIGNTVQTAKMVSDESVMNSYEKVSISSRLSSSSHSSDPSGHYGVLGTCESSLTYYEAAADGIMDELESGPLRGKVTPSIDQHRLAEIYQRGAPSALSSNNKPDELEEALTYYKMRASPKNPQPDVHAAYKLANMYHHGFKGVKQDMEKALKYYSIAADSGSWEAAGQAGKFHLWGMGVEENKRDLKKSYNYFSKATPGGLDSCKYRYNRDVQRRMNFVEGDLDDESSSELSLCDHPAVNGMGLLHVLGVPMTVPVNLTLAQEYFMLARDMGNMDSYYNLAMLYLGWMNPEFGNALTKRNIKRNSEHGPSRKDLRNVVTYLDRASKMGHYQAKYRLAKIYAHGISLEGKSDVTESDVAVQNSCPKALKLYRELTNSGTTISRRMRVAYKQYIAADYESSLRNYLAAAETGSMDAQVNAAFLLEQEHCLGMSTSQCLKASLRMWKAAAQQGNEEACLRVGDFYYYNRFDDDEVMKRANIYSVTTFPYIRYLLYPEDLLRLIKESIIKGIKNFFRKRGSDSIESYAIERNEICSSNVDFSGVCPIPQVTPVKYEGIDKKRLALAAKYYQKAAEEHSSERANFNLGFMHEWGLGLTQDFPLAKRHYDLAMAGKSGDGFVAVQIALTCMNAHESAVRLGLSLKKWWNPQRPSTVSAVVISHVLSWESITILALALVLKKLMFQLRSRMHY